MVNALDCHFARKMRSLLALMCSGVFAVALGQSPDRFPDSKENHWAFTALDQLKKDGILVGYPDGLYRGERPATRFELAAAVHAAYLKIKTQSDSLNGQIDALKQKMDQGGVSKADYDNLKNAIQELVASKPDYFKDIADLKKLMKEFEPELTALGADMDAVRKQLGGLDERVGKLEKRKPPVDFRGTVDTVTLGGFSRDNTIGYSVDGRPTGVGRGDNVGQPVGLTRDLSLFHELGLTFTDNTNPDPNWRVVLAVGNMLDDFVNRQDTGLADQANTGFTSGTPFHEGAETIYLPQASAKFEGKAHRIPYRVEMGRFGHQISAYTYQRPDTTPYFTNDRWDNGDWSSDGFLARLGFGAKTLNLFIAKPSNGTFVAKNGNGFATQTMLAGASGAPFALGTFRPLGVSASNQMVVNTVMGMDFKAPFLKNGELTATYLNLASNGGAFAVQQSSVASSVAFPKLPVGSPGQPYNNVELFGVSFHALVGGLLPLHGSFAQTNLKRGNETVQSHDNQAMELGITKDSGKGLGFKAGFRSIGANFGAPGDWGRIGMWWNPTNINDFYLTPTLPLGKNWDLEVENHYATGLGKGRYLISTVQLDALIFIPFVPMGSGDHQVNTSVHFKHKLSGNTKMVFGVENAAWHIKNRTDAQAGDLGGNPTERWYDFGINMGKGATNFSFLFQLSDYDAHNAQGFGLPNPIGSFVFGNPFSNNNIFRAKGGLISTQVSSHF